MRAPPILRPSLLLASAIALVSACSPTTPGCSAATTVCGDRCAELQTDPDHCGSCGTTCTSGVCNLGSCLVSFGDSGAVGSWAHRYLAADPYPSLRVVVDYVTGRQPSQSALDLLQQRLTERLRKPGGVQVTVGKELSSGGRTVYSVADSSAVEHANRIQFAAGGSAVIYLTYLNGHSDQDTGNSAVLGWSYTGTSISVFKDVVDQQGSLLVSSAEVEGAVLVHEVGHLLGLVDTGSPMVTPHAAHGAHCDVQDCVMYWALDTSDVVQLVGNLGHLPTQFDAHCLADLGANGGQ